MLVQRAWRSPREGDGGGAVDVDGRPAPEGQAGSARCGGRNGEARAGWTVTRSRLDNAGAAGLALATGG
jgi:hypothetical protein